jgi:hypothetical protein
MHRDADSIRIRTLAEAALWGGVVAIVLALLIAAWHVATAVSSATPNKPAPMQQPPAADAHER